MNFLKDVDPVIFKLVQQEKKRQEETLMMIPSENYASQAIRDAMGTVLSNKYSEGYPNARYYEGNEYIDQVELLAIERIQKLFNVPYVNVQPHSGSPANAAVYFALLQPGDTIMGLSLASGGHLTHGVPNITFSGKYFRSIQYEVGKDEYIDYDALEKLALQEKPKMIIAGTTHYPRFLDFKRFSQIAEKVDALLMADVSHVVGLIIGGVYPSPIAYAHVVTTTTHKTLRGPRGAIIMVTKKGLAKDSEMGKKIDKAIIPGMQGGPHNNQTAAIAVAIKEASGKRFIKYAQQIVKNAKVLEKELKKYGYRLVTGGTDSHVLLIDIRSIGLLGNTAATGLNRAGVVLNRNKIPFDPNSPIYPSGLRMGTPALTSRGMKKKEMVLVAKIINEALMDMSKNCKELNISIEAQKKRAARWEIINRSKALYSLAKQVKVLCKRFPVKQSY